MPLSKRLEGVNPVQRTAKLTDACSARCKAVLCTRTPKIGWADHKTGCGHTFWRLLSPRASTRTRPPRRLVIEHGNGQIQSNTLKRYRPHNDHACPPDTGTETVGGPTREHAQKKKAADGCHGSIPGSKLTANQPLVLVVTHTSSAVLQQFVDNSRRRSRCGARSPAVFPRKLHSLLVTNNFPGTQVEPSRALLTC